MGDTATTTSSLLEERAIRKITWRLIPFLMLLYFVAFLDRINVGFAALTMNRDIGLTSQMFGLGSGIFFIGYFVFEVPSTVILHKVGARFWKKASPSAPLTTITALPRERFATARHLVAVGNAAPPRPSRLARSICSMTLIEVGGDPPPPGNLRAVQRADPGSPR